MRIVLRQHAHGVEGPRRVRLEAGEQGVEVGGCRTLLGDELEGLPFGSVGAEAADQNLRDLAAGDDAGVAGAVERSVASQPDVLLGSGVGGMTMSPVGATTPVTSPLAE